jgi:hypothetical protein
MLMNSQKIKNPDISAQLEVPSSPAFLFITTIVGGNIQDTMVRIMQLITMGSLLRL